MLVSKELGGAGLIGLELARSFRDKIRQNCVWIPGEGPAAAKAREIGCWHQSYDPTGALTSSRVGSLLCNLKIGRLLHQYQPGIIHVHSPLYYGALSRGLKLSKLKTVVHLHLGEDKQVLRWALKIPPDVIITCANFLVELVRSAIPEKRQTGQKIVSVPNAVDIAKFYPGEKLEAKRRIGALPEIPLVLMVANLAAHKGHETALRAASILKQRGVIAQLWFAGVERGARHDYAGHLQKLMYELGLNEQVRFLGQRTDIPELLRAADCFVLPSTSEGLPLSILEAQASKLPVLAAPTGGIPDVVAHNKTGFVISADDPAGYAEYMTRLFKNKKLSLEIAENAYHVVLQQHSWKSYRERIWNIYNNLLHS